MPKAVDIPIVNDKDLLEESKKLRDLVGEIDKWSTGASPVVRISRIEKILAQYGLMEVLLKDRDIPAPTLIAHSNIQKGVFERIRREVMELRELGAQ